MRTRDALVVLTILSLSAPHALATPFVPESVASGYNDLGRYNSLALDLQGNPRISFYDGTFGTLRYASRSASGTWTSETADAGGSDYVGLYTSLKLDAAGNPRISYYDSTAQDLRYASKSGATWTVETVDSPGNRGQYCSLALDALGNPHISYYNATSGYLMYAAKTGGTWTIEIADPAPVDFVGKFTSIAVDGLGRPHISYWDETAGSLKYATKRADGTWLLETVDALAIASGTSLLIDPQGNPAIAYHRPGLPSVLEYASRVTGTWSTEDASGGVLGGGDASLAFEAQGNPRVASFQEGGLRYMVRSGGVWAVENLDYPAGGVGARLSLALDPQGTPKISYFTSTVENLKLVDSAVRVASPTSGVTWPVGALRSIDWRGIGPVTISLSADGGASYQTLLEGIGASPVSIRVPHTPTHFARVKVERGYPLSTAFSESTFTIQTSVSLLSLLAARVPDDGTGAVITWSTDPGPADLSGYRLERASAVGSAWSTIVALTRETSYEDAAAGPASRYRLFAVNGFGEELLLGETSLRPSAPIAAWPLPYRGGNLSIAFATGAGLGGTLAPFELSLYDISGRLVRRIAEGVYPAGYHSAVWDGRDGGGRTVASGIYFLRSKSAGEQRNLKVVVAR